MVTPEALRSMTFTRAPLRRRGYVEDEVHVAISRAAAALSSLAEENARLRAEMQRHRDWIRANNLSDGSPTGVPGVDAVLQHARAQQVAEQTVSVARQQAKSLVQSARAQAEAILQRSWEQATQAVAQASAGGVEPEEADRLITYLRSMAESLATAADEFATNRARPTVGSVAGHPAPGVSSTVGSAAGHPAPGV